MQRFAQMFVDRLPGHGVSVSFAAPHPLFGALIPGAHGVGKWLGYLDKFVVFPWVLRQRIKAAKTQSLASGASLVVHVIDHSCAHYTRYLRDVPHVVTCHDLLAIRAARAEFSNVQISWTGRQLQQTIQSGLSRAQMIVADSEATKGDLSRLTGRSTESTSVIYCGLNYPYSPLGRDEARRYTSDIFARAGIKCFDGPFLMHVGGDHWYKNRAGVIDIYVALRKEIQDGRENAPKLVFIGPSLSTEAKTRCCEQVISAEDIIVLNGVSNQELQALYSAAEFLIFPSIEEGFGWPIIEAQACGCRVATTAKAPMTEVGGNAAVYLDPRDVSPSDGGCLRRAACQLKELLDEGAEARLSRITGGLQNAKRFAAAEMIAAYVEVYRTIAQSCEREVAKG